MRVQRKVNRLPQKHNLRRPFDQPQVRNIPADVFQRCLRSRQLQPVHSLFIVWVTAHFFFVGKYRVERRIKFRQLLNRRPHLPKSLHVRKSRPRLNPRIARRHPHAIPFFPHGILLRHKENLSRAGPVIPLCLAVRRWQQDQSRPLLVVPRQVIKIVLLRENVALRIHLSPIQPGQYDRSVHRSRQLRSSRCVNGVRLTLASLLRTGRQRHKQRHQGQQTQRRVSRTQHELPQMHTNRNRTTHPATSVAPRAEGKP